MKKVVVGISGGVDSAICAYLLLKKGYEVIGVTLRFIDSDITDAIKVCEKLNIKHEIIDKKDEFQKEIIDSFIQDYKKGLTPNPCVTCNKKMKLKYLEEVRKKYNADFLATGHYAKIKDGCLYRSKDDKKDQTYFLCEVEKSILEKTLFPLEEIKKEEVRNIAEEIGLSVAHKKDSLDVCFIKDSFKSFMEKHVKKESGDVILMDSGALIGTHEGLPFYTIGQRKGLHIGGYEDKLFVVGKDVSKNILYVAIGSENKYLYSNSCTLRDVNLRKEKVGELTAKFRYRSSEVKVNLEIVDGNYLVTYEDTKAVTPGQACVFYDKEECIGGGIIDEVRYNHQKLWYL